MMQLITRVVQVSKIKVSSYVVLTAMLGLTACAGSSVSNNANKATIAKSTTVKKADAANAFKITFDWQPGMNACFSRKSPPIKLMNVPAGTKSLSVVMEDEDSNYDHGGGKVVYQGVPLIPAGALKRWEGPCPPSQHKYTFKVTTYGGEKAVARFSQNYPK